MGGYVVDGTEGEKWEQRGRKKQRWILNNKKKKKQGNGQRWRTERRVFNRVWD